MQNHLKNKYNSWNRIGKIKSFALMLIGLSYVALNIPLIQVPKSIIPTIGGFLFGFAGLPLIIKINRSILKLEFQKGSWNQLPIPGSKNLSFFQFAGYLFVSVGVGFLLSSLLHYQAFDWFGLHSTAFGLGIILGIKRMKVS